MITELDFNWAFDYLVDNHGLALPYHVHPADSLPESITEELWGVYEWNPPEGHDAPDLVASPKPTWDEIIQASLVEQVQRYRRECFEHLDPVSTRRIAQLYHPKADRQPEKEWQVRLSGIDTFEQDAERLRLVKRHNEIKQRIENMTDPARLKVALSILDSDALWNAAIFPDTFPA